MTKRQLEEATISELVDIYVDAAIVHGQSTLTGDTKANHQSYEAIAGVYREFRERGAEYEPALLNLVDHPDRSVATWAAAHALDFAPAEAEAALARIAKTGDILGFNAEMTLSEWRKGNLTFP